MDLVSANRAKIAQGAFGKLMSDYSEPAGEKENEAPEVEMMNDLLEVVATAKRYHWATVGLGEHEALAFFYDNIEDKIDDFVEIFQGFTGARLKGANELEIPEYTLDAAVAFLTSFNSCLSNCRMLVPVSSLNNIIDDMQNLVGKTLYKLSLVK